MEEMQASIESSVVFVRSFTDRRGRTIPVAQVFDRSVIELRRRQNRWTRQESLGE